MQPYDALGIYSIARCLTGQAGQAKDKGGAAAAGYAAASAVLGTHNAGVGLLHEGMREIAVVPCSVLALPVSNDQNYTRPRRQTTNLNKWNFPGCLGQCSSFFCSRVVQVLLACGEMQRQCLDLKLDAQRSIATSAKTPHISYSKYADFLDEARSIQMNQWEHVMTSGKKSPQDEEKTRWTNRHMEGSDLVMMVVMVLLGNSLNDKPVDFL